jgi:hypothetical protein
MSFAKELNEIPSQAKYFVCSVKKILDTLDKTDRQALEAAIDRVRTGNKTDKKSGLDVWSGVWLRKVLIDNGYKIGKDSLRKHLEGLCNCGNI